MEIFLSFLFLFLSGFLVYRFPVWGVASALIGWSMYLVGGDPVWRSVIGGLFYGALVNYIVVGFVGVYRHRRETTKKG